MNERDDGTRKVRDYVSQRMNAEMPPDFVGGVMNEVRQTPQRGRWRGWPLVAGLATVTAAVAAVGISLSLARPGGVGSTSPSPTVVSVPSPTPIASEPAETSAPSPSEEPLPSGEFGPVWQMDAGAAFGDAAACENLAALPTLEQGENIAWRIWRPASWSTQAAYLGDCMWFAPQPWDVDLENPVPPEEVSIVIAALDGRVTPGSPEFEGGSVTGEERFTVAGQPAVRYVISGSDGEFLRGDGVIWVIGVQGALPDFEGLVTPNYVVAYTSSPAEARLIQQVETLDRMVATIDFPEPAPACVDAPTITDLMAQPNAVSCWGSRELTVEGWIHGIGAYSPMLSVTPTWLCCESRQIVPASDYWDVDGQWFVLHPDSGISDADLPGESVRVRVTGHFDDPAAAGCEFSEDYSHLGTAASEAPDFCRSKFVVTSIEAIGG
jgi:hypothetical protein